MYVYKNPHQQSYLAAVQEVEELRQECAQHMERMAGIEQRLEQLAAYLKAIQPLMEAEPGQSLGTAGLTQICRDLLNQVNRWVTAPEVREILSQKGVDISRYSNPLAVLHSVLRRVGQTCKAKDNTWYGNKGLPLIAPLLMHGAGLPEPPVEQAPPSAGPIIPAGEHLEK